MRNIVILSLSGVALAALATPVLAAGHHDRRRRADDRPRRLDRRPDEARRRSGRRRRSTTPAGSTARKIKIVVEDDACDPKQAVAVANLIVGQQIKFVDGHACSGSSIPASDIYAENNVLMMSPASSNPVLTEKGHPNVLRLYGRDDAQGAFIASLYRRASTRARRSQSCTTSRPTAKASPPWSRTS